MTRVQEVSGERVARLAQLTTRFYPAGLVRVSGNGDMGCTMPAAYAQRADEVLAMEVREDDVWVVAPPKCGSTLILELVWLLQNNLDLDAAKATPLAQRFQSLEYNLLSDTELEHTSSHNLKDIQSKPSPRCIHSHLPKHLLPQQLWTKKPKIIYLAREAKDVAVSCFHYERLSNGYKGDQDFYYACFMDDLILYCPYWEHVLQFWEMRKQPHIFFTTFEDMKKNLSSVIRKTSKFLGHDSTEDQVVLLADHLEFRRMRENPSVNLVPELEAALGAPLSQEHGGGLLRRGEMGEGRRQMSPMLAARFDSWSRQRLAGSDFPWLP